MKRIAALGPALAMLVLSTLAVAPRADTWRATALASFDETWQTIADTFPDPTFGGLDWNGVKRELRPRVEHAASADEARAAIREMLARLKLSHFRLMSEAVDVNDGPVGEASVPIDVRIAAEGVVITHVEPASTAGRAGVTAGQLILAIDGTSVETLAAEHDETAERVQAMDRWRATVRLLHGALGSTAVLTVRSIDGHVRQLRVTRVLESGQTVTLGNLPPLAVRTEVKELRSPAGRRIGFVGFNVWMTAIDEPFAAAIDRFRAADGLVIDLRGNPGGLAGMISGIAGYLIDDPSALIGRMQTRDMPLEFHPNPRRSTPDGRKVRPFAGPVAILVDELTGSASECFAGGLQSLGRARLFGRQTMGEALPALTKRLPNGDVLMYAVGTFVTSSGRTLEGEGILPDEQVPLSIPALARGQDADVNAALRWFDRAR